MVRIILTSMLYNFHCYHLKLSIFVKKKISYCLWQPPTLNEYLTTYMSGKTTTLQHRSCFKSSSGSYWLVEELLFLGSQGSIGNWQTQNTQHKTDAHSNSTNSLITSLYTDNPYMTPLEFAAVHACPSDNNTLEPKYNIN